MSATIGFNRCLSFINCQLQVPGGRPHAGDHRVKCITISRQSGCGAHVFAEELAARLQARIPGGATPWTIFDHSLVEAVLRDHNLPARLAAFMPEDRVPQLNDIIENLLSLHPPAETLLRQTTETIVRLAELGNVIILGRGANIITARLPDALHIRLVGAVKQRIAHLQLFDKLNGKDALERIVREDGGRSRYLKRYFGKDIDDPLNYHMIINTDNMTLQEAAALVADLAVQRSLSSAPAPVQAAA
jgi:cytidylate kinase